MTTGNCCFICKTGNQSNNEKCSDTSPLVFPGWIIHPLPQCGALLWQPLSLLQNIWVDVKLFMQFPHISVTFHGETSHIRLENKCIMENGMFSRHSPFCIFRYFCNMVHVKWNVIIKYSGQAAAMFSVFHNTHIFWPYMASLPMECCRNWRKSYTQFHLHPILLETNALAYYTERQLD
jgi:hypothetical protein